METTSPATAAAPGEPPKRKSISVTKIKRLFRCGELFRLMDIEKKKFPPPTFLTKGSAVHSASEVNFKQKIQSRTDLSSSKIKEAAASAFDERIKAEGVALTKKEEDAGVSISLGRAKDRTVVLAGIYSDQIAPVHQPRIVEELQKIRLTDELDLAVKLDLINEQEEIVDLKTGKKSIPQADVNEDLQFSIYDLAYRALFKKPPRGTVIENLVDAPVNPKRNQIHTSRSTAQLEGAVKKINNFIFAVQKGIFLPAQKGSWYCNEEHCPAARECKYFEWYQRGGGDAPKPFWYNNWRAKKAAASKEKP